MSKKDTITKWEEQLHFEKLPLWSDYKADFNRRCHHISVDESSSSRPRVNNLQMNISILEPVKKHN